MSNRKLAYIVKDQKPLVLEEDALVRAVCRAMTERGAGSALVVDDRGRLSGIFTGRDAVRLLAKTKAPEKIPVAKAMTRDPVRVTPEARAIDALKEMCEGGFRHIPVVDKERIWGVVSRGDFKGAELEALRWCLEQGPSTVTPNRELGQMVKRQRPVALASTDTVQTACASMWKRKAGAVLVVDARKRLVGIFTGRDAVRTLANAKNPAATRLSSAMTRKPIAVMPACCAADALHCMSDGGFRHLPVVDGAKILGVVSRGDFLGEEIDRLDEEEHLFECLR